MSYYDEEARYKEWRKTSMKSAEKRHSSKMRGASWKGFGREHKAEEDLFFQEEMGKEKDYLDACAIMYC